MLEGFHDLILRQLPDVLLDNFPEACSGVQVDSNLSPGSRNVTITCSISCASVRAVRQFCKNHISGEIKLKLLVIRGQHSRFDPVLLLTCEAEGLTVSVEELPRGESFTSACVSNEIVLVYLGTFFAFARKWHS